MPKTTKSKYQNEKHVFVDIAARLRQFANRPNIYGYKPHPKQYEFHSSMALGKQFIGGNRSGKTVSGAVESIWWALGKHPYRETPPPPVRGRVVAVDFLNGVEKIVRPEVARWIPLSELLGGSWETAYNRELRTLTLENGSFIEFMSYDQDVDKFAGTSRHFTWFDEEPPKDIWTECKMRLLDTGGSWWMTMTPVEGMTWTYDHIYEASRIDPHLKIIIVNTHENTYVSEAEVNQIMSGLTKEERKARIEGRYIQRTGLIYKHFDPDVHVLGGYPTDYVPQKRNLWVAALDHGYNNPTAWIWAEILRDGSVVVFDEHYESGRLVKHHAQIVQERDRSHGREPNYRVGDPSIRNVDPIQGTSIHLEYLDHGVPILLGNNDVSAGIQRVARYIGEPPFGINNRPKLYVTANCTNLIWEINRYRWGRWVNKVVERERNRKEEPMKRDDHAVDALRYLIASRPEVEDLSQPEPQEWERLAQMAGATKAVKNPFERVDEGLTKQRPKGEYTDADFTLGGEW